MGRNRNNNLSIWCKRVGQRRGWLHSIPGMGSWSWRRWRLDWSCDCIQAPCRLEFDPRALRQGFTQFNAVASDSSENGSKSYIFLKGWRSLIYLPSVSRWSEQHESTIKQQSILLRIRLSFQRLSHPTVQGLGSSELKILESYQGKKTGRSILWKYKI